MNKLADKFFNGINLFGEQVEPLTEEYYCTECGNYITGKIYTFLDLSFCSTDCKSDYQDKLK